MKRKLKIVGILFVTFFFCSENFAQESNGDSINIYLVKESWHTGLMIPVNDFTKKILPVINFFEDFQYVDIGWGDADFYQAPGFDLFLAAKAVLIPTPTVIRIDGYRFPIERVIQWRDFAIKFELTKEEFIRLANFIKESFKYTNDNQVIISSVNEKKTIMFFKSVHYYSCLKTCNTWAAEAIQASGKDVDTFGLVTADQLFGKLSKFGKVLKRKE